MLHSSILVTVMQVGVGADRRRLAQATNTGACSVLVGAVSRSSRLLLSETHISVCTLQHSCRLDGPRLLGKSAVAAAEALGEH